MNNKLQKHNIILITTMLLCLLLTTATHAREKRALERPAIWDTSAKHVIVYDEQGKFAGWPANEGIWSWGDEIVVGFNIGEYLPGDPGHDCNLEKPLATVQARSLDGGRTWTLEKPAAFARGREPMTLSESINFTHPDFTLKCRNTEMYYSYDRGRDWRGPFRIPAFGQMPLKCRTDYIVNDTNDCFVFVTADKPDGIEGYVFAIHTTDGGRTFEFLSWIAPIPPLFAGNHAYSVQPATLRLSDNHLITGIRERRQKKKWIDIYESTDNGQSWQWLSTPIENNSWNPPSLLRLQDGTICLMYGYRAARPQEGIRVLFSRDQGKTWSKQYYLRDDGREWDLGYVRSVQRPDGKVVSVYYYTTDDMPRQHIAATIWDAHAREVTY